MPSVFIGLAHLIEMAITIYIYIVIARALISWVSPDPYNPVVRFLHNATDPVLYRMRRMLPFSTGSFDLRPMILIFALYLLKGCLVNLLVTLSQSF